MLPGVRGTGTIDHCLLAKSSRKRANLFLSIIPQRCVSGMKFRHPFSIVAWSIEVHADTRSTGKISRQSTAVRNIFFTQQSSRLIVAGFLPSLLRLAIYFSTFRRVISPMAFLPK